VDWPNPPTPELAASLNAHDDTLEMAMLAATPTSDPTIQRERFTEE